MTVRAVSVQWNAAEPSVPSESGDAGFRVWTVLLKKTSVLKYSKCSQISGTNWRRSMTETHAKMTRSPSPSPGSATFEFFLSCPTTVHHNIAITDSGNTATQQNIHWVSSFVQV
jgi:hypothetical protein